MKLALLLVGSVALMIALAVVIRRFLIRYEHELGSGAPKGGGEPTRFVW